MALVLMQPRDKLKLDIMLALKREPMSLCQLAEHVGDLSTKASHIAKALEELVASGDVAMNEESSTVGHLYTLVSEDSLSDLSAKLLPHRDPVREAHAHEAAQERSRVFRYTKDDGADLGEDD